MRSPMKPRQRVGRPAGRERHDDGDRLVRIGLRGGAGRRLQSAQRQSHRTLMRLLLTTASDHARCATYGSGLMLAASMIGHHFSISALTQRGQRRPASADRAAGSSAPSSVSLARTPSSASASTTAALSLCDDVLRRAFRHPEPVPERQMEARHDRPRRRSGSRRRGQPRRRHEARRRGPCRCAPRQGACRRRQTGHVDLPAHHVLHAPGPRRLYGTNCNLLWSSCCEIEAAEMRGRAGPDEALRSPCPGSPSARRSAPSASWPADCCATAPAAGSPPSARPARDRSSRRSAADRRRR